MFCRTTPNKLLLNRESQIVSRSVHIRHISYCHLVPRQVICQTAGSRIPSSRLYLYTGCQVKRLKAHFNFKSAMMKNPTLHVLLNSTKAHREHINLPHAGASEDVSHIRVPRTTQAFPHCNLLTAGLMDASCDLCLVSLQTTSGFSLLLVFTQPVLGHLVLLSQCAARCYSPRFVAGRQNNWWYQLSLLTVLLWHQHTLLPWTEHLSKGPTSTFELIMSFI